MNGGEGASSHWHVRTARMLIRPPAVKLRLYARMLIRPPAVKLRLYARMLIRPLAVKYSPYAHMLITHPAVKLSRHARIVARYREGRHAVDGDEGGATGGVGSGRATAMGAAGLLATRTQAVGRPGWCSRVSQQLRLTEQQGPPDRRADQPLHTPVAPRSRVQQLRRCPAVARRPTVPLAARRRRPGRATGGRRTGGPTNSAARRPSPRSPSNRCRRIGRAPPSSSLSLSTNSSARRPSPLRALGDNGAGDVGACSQCDQLALRYALGLVACRGSARE